MSDRTPGETAYEAFMASLALAHPTPWHRQDTAYQAHWEAAAQAVLDAAAFPPLDLTAREEEEPHA